MIIVNPDEISILHILDDGLGKELVDFLVGSPGGLVECNLTRMIVE